MELDPNQITVAQLESDFWPATTLYTENAHTSRQRVHQLIAADQVDHVKLRSHHYITKASWAEYRANANLRNEPQDNQWTGNPDHLHSHPGACVLLGIKYGTLSIQARTGAISTVMVEGVRRYQEKELARYLTEQARKTGRRSVRYGHRSAGA